MKFVSALKNTVTASVLTLALAAPLLGGRAAALDSTIANPNLSQSANGLPVGWQTDNWGNLTANFSYLTQGQNDTSSVEVAVSNYQDGDAKWYFNPIALTGGQAYTFTDYYRSNQTTNVWAQLSDAAGTVSYQWLGTDAPSSTWQPGTFNLNVPSGIVSGTIFHVLSATGYLDTDSFSLTPVVQPICSPSQASGLYNGSFAESCDNGLTPVDWQTADYGTNSANFSYLTTGYDDNHSAQMAITNYTSGEAGWVSNPQAAASNQRYRLTAFLKGNTYAYAYVEVKLTNGTYTYLSLMSVPAPGNEWSAYDDAFVTPANTSTISVHVAISSIGTMQLDDLHLLALTNYANNAFTTPMVSIDFDDGDKSAYSNALPVLTTLGIKSTFYINGSTIGTTGYMTKAQVKALASAGHEIGSHSYEHIDLAQTSAANLLYEINQNQTFLQSVTGIQPTTFATPYGSYNSRVLDTITGVVPYVRDTDNAMNHKYNFNARTVHAIDVTSSMTPASLAALAKQAQQQGAWLVLVYHDIAASGDQYTVSKANLQKELQAIKNTGIQFKTNQQAISAILPQL